MFLDSYAYTFASRRYFGLNIRPRFVFYRSFHTIIHTDAFLRVFVGFLGFFIWCIYVRECAVRSTLRDVFQQLLSRVRTRASLQFPSPTSLRFSLFNYRRLSAIFGRRCAAVVGGPDAFWPVVAVSSAGKGRVRLSRWLVTLEPKTSALEVT